MNRLIIVYILGNVLKITGVLLLLPIVTGIIYHEATTMFFVYVALGCIAGGLLLTLKKPKNQVFYLKEGCVATALSWIVISIVGALPFCISGQIPSFTDAMFETVSGFTTTGASILTDVESLDKCMLMWRSFTHWIGGMGVLVFLLAVIPLNGGSHMNLMKAESPGPSVGKLVPKVKYTARILYAIYIAITIIELVLLLIARMPVFDALCTSFGTAGTGGFGIKNDSMAGYSPAIQWIVTIFMILFGVNFNAYYYILFRHIRKALSMEEVRCYFAIILTSIAIIFFNILDTSANALTALRDASFQVGSIITTTGFSTVDFNQWSDVCKVVLVLLMFIGACAGSTGGGIKVSRFVVLMKTLVKELNSYIHPKSVKKIKIDDKPVEHEVVRAVNVYFITFVIIFSASVLLVSFEDTDLVTTFTAVAATINNIGPGLGLVGPAANFSIFNPFTKYVLIFDMLAGRLELFPLLILFHPTIWKEMIALPVKTNKKKA